MKESTSGIRGIKQSVDYSIEKGKVSNEQISTSRLKSTSSAEGTNSAVIEADSLALVALYNATNGSNWTNNDNWLTGPVSTWYGIEVSGSRVVKIELKENNLHGSIPGELGDLTNLEELILYNNQLISSIPSELGNLTNLNTLILMDNLLSGNVPSEIGNLTSLQFLFMNNNQLSGLPNLSALTSLAAIGLYYNEFSFGDLDSTKLDFSFPNLAYSPQKFLPQPAQTDNGDGTSSLTLTTDGTGNKYQWYKNDIAIAGENSDTIRVDNTEESYYYCLVSNPNYPELVLKTMAVVFNLTIKQGVLETEYNSLVAFYD